MRVTTSWDGGYVYFWSIVWLETLLGGPATCTFPLTRSLPETPSSSRPKKPASSAVPPAGGVVSIAGGGWGWWATGGVTPWNVAGNSLQPQRFCWTVQRMVFEYRERFKWQQRERDWNNTLDILEVYQRVYQRGNSSQP